MDDGKINLYIIYMTCFWNGLIKAITEPVIQDTLNYNGKICPHTFIKLLKGKNKLTKNVLWCGAKVNKILLNENKKAVKELDITQINNGYLCSSCDCFMMLVCELFKCDINHNYNKSNITYKYKKQSIRIIQVNNNVNHFW